MSSEKKVVVAMLAVALLISTGCSRNKQAVAPATSGYAASQPAVAAAAPAPAARRSSTYIK